MACIQTFNFHLLGLLVKSWISVLVSLINLINILLYLVCFQPTHLDLIEHHISILLTISISQCCLMIFLLSFLSEMNIIFRKRISFSYKPFNGRDDVAKPILLSTQLMLKGTCAGDFKQIISNNNSRISFEYSLRIK